MASKLASSEAELSKFLSIFSLTITITLTITIKQRHTQSVSVGESECIMYNIEKERGGRGDTWGKGIGAEDGSG